MLALSESLNLPFVSNSSSVMPLPQPQLLTRNIALLTQPVHLALVLSPALVLGATNAIGRKNLEANVVVQALVLQALVQLVLVLQVLVLQALVLSPALVLGATNVTGNVTTRSRV